MKSVSVFLDETKKQNIVLVDQKEKTFLGVGVGGGAVLPSSQFLN